MGVTSKRNNPTICAVCDVSASTSELAECAECGEWFHLELNQHSLRRSCGAATFGNACGFSFTCDPCIARYEVATTTDGHWRTAVR